MSDMDGSYFAIGRDVWRRPLRSPTGISMGFRVCRLHDGVSDDGAQEIADALNAADAKRTMDAAIAADRDRNEA